MITCDWFNDDVIKLKQISSNQTDFNFIEPPKNYQNIITDLKKSSKIVNLNLQHNEIKDEDLISTHKYKINFSESQHKILVEDFKECLKLYNLCVDIWTEYKDMSDNYFIVKDVIFNYLYRQNNDNIDNIKQLIISELKDKKKEYDIENEINKDKIKILKDIAKQKYKDEMVEYKRLQKLNKKATIKIKLDKPKLEKIKINKIKNPPKPRGKVIEKPSSDETLKYEIKDFCKNLKNARQQAFDNGYYNSELNKFNDDSFELKHKDITKTQTIYISKRSINKKGIFTRKLGNLNCENYKKILGKYEITKDCFLQYNYKFKKYYFLVVHDDKYVDINTERQDIVAIDQGEKIFMYFYSNNLQGKIGDNMRIKILKKQREIKKYQSIINKNKNKSGNKIRNLSKLKVKMNKLYLDIKNYVNEIHKKSAKFLCENYKNILLPKFETKPMISKYKITEEENRIKKLSKENGKQELKKLKKIVRLSNEVKFVLSMQSHYRFKEYLKHYAKKYRTIIHDVDESYTSQCCSNCGILSKVYDNKRIKKCVNCNYKIDRDENGAYNIYLKCVVLMPDVMSVWRTFNAIK
jgi:putative transposase